MKMLWRRKTFTKRRAPIAPPEFVQQVNQVVRGWATYYRHTNASQAFRALQRFINVRFRRYLTCRSKGRGFGWKRYPNRALYARGIIYIGSRVIRWEGNGEPAMTRLVRHCHGKPAATDRRRLRPYLEKMLPRQRGVEALDWGFHLFCHPSSA